MVLGKLSFAEQVRISMNFGLTAIHLASVVLSIFIGSTLVNKEIEKKTIMTLLVRPITRGQFIVGKALGLSLVNLVVIIGLAGTLSAVLFFLGARFQASFFWAIVGVLLESFILLGFALFFSSFSTPFMVVSFVFGVFLIGHWQDSLRFFVNKSESSAFQAFQMFVSRAWPDLEIMNWRSQAVYAESILSKEILFASLYAVAWFGLLIALTSLILRRRDFA
jgi:Cu-processing system permease protein